MDSINLISLFHRHLLSFFKAKQAEIETIQKATPFAKVIRFNSEISVNTVQSSFYAKATANAISFPDSQLEGKQISFWLAKVWLNSNTISSLLIWTVLTALLEMSECCIHFLFLECLNFFKDFPAILHIISCRLNLNYNYYQSTKCRT